MIRLNRPPAPAGHAARASRGAVKLLNAWNTSGSLPTANAGIYAHAQIKAKLKSAQSNKCAYCETVNPTSHDVVEHFRPKNGWRQQRGDSLAQPAYFWLSYEWTNLLFACDRCNDGGHKENLFPLADPSRRARVESRDVAGEVPLLVDPYAEDPEQFIEWNRDVPRPRNGSSKGQVTIETFKLAHDGLLLEQRRDYLRQVEEILSFLEVSTDPSPQRVAVCSTLRECIADSAPWAAMVRQNLGDRIRAL